MNALHFRKILDYVQARETNVHIGLYDGHKVFIYTDTGGYFGEYTDGIHIRPITIEPEPAIYNIDPARPFTLMPLDTVFRALNVLSTPLDHINVLAVLQDYVWLHDTTNNTSYEISGQGLFRVLASKGV